VPCRYCRRGVLARLRPLPTVNNRGLQGMAGNKLRLTGGARIAGVNVTWPFAILTVSRDELDLNASLIGKYRFSPDQVISIEKHVSIPLLAWGIRIHHNVPDYPQEIVFWHVASPDSLLKMIEETGFVPSADRESALPPRGMSVRWQAVVVLMILFALDVGHWPAADVGVKRG